MENWDGFNPINKANISEAAVARFIDLMANKGRLPGWKQEYMLREVITTSDFPNLFGFTLERDMMARYKATIPDWESYVKRGTVPNFTATDLHKVQGNDGLMPRVPEKNAYTASPMSDAMYHKQVFKWGRMFDISWESLINDALNAFGDMPQRFADAVTYTRAYNATDLFVSAAGPDVGLFGAPIADVDLQNVTNLGALALNIANLQTTFNLMAAQLDVLGKPISPVGVHLVVPPMLRLRAMQILNSTDILDVTAGTAVGTRNVIADVGIRLHVNPLIPVIDVSGNRNFTWYLFADYGNGPGQGAAMEMDYLRGYEDPEIVMKASNKVAVGGGTMATAFSGDFDTDDILYRVRDIHGGVRLDPRFAYAQVSAA